MTRRKRRRIRAFLFFTFIIIALGFAFILIEERLSPVVADISRQAVKSKVSVIISKTVYDEIKKSGVTYDKLISLEKDANGQITALKSNIIEINRLKSALSLEILEQLEEIDDMDITIPMGSIFGSEILSGRGPKMHIKIMPVGTVATDVENRVSSTGINQTRHQVMLRINVQTAIITALRSTSADISTDVCIAETVLVGNVPETYTAIDAHKENADGEDNTVIDPDDIFNFVY